MIASEIPCHSAFRPVFPERRITTRRRVIDGTTHVASLEARGPSHGVSTFHARVHDVSVTGMKIRSEVALRPGDQHWFRIELPGKAAIRVRGQVAWTRAGESVQEGFPAGISFLAMREERAMVLRSLLAD